MGEEAQPDPVVAPLLSEWRLAGPGALPDHDRQPRGERPVITVFRCMSFVGIHTVFGVGGRSVTVAVFRLEGREGISPGHAQRGIPQRRNSRIERVKRELNAGMTMQCVCCK
jgi:hypothetical protein